jgi:hypothetical protein
MSIHIYIQIYLELIVVVATGLDDEEVETRGILCTIFGGLFGTLLAIFGALFGKA